MTLTARLIANAGGISLFFLAGFALLQFFPGLLRRSRIVRAAFAYLLGVAGLSGGVWALNHFVGWPLRRTLILWLLVAIIAAGAAVRLLRRGDLPRPETVPLWTRLSRVVMAAAVLVAFYATLGLLSDSVSNVTQDFDGQMTWTVAARYVRDAASVDTPVLREERFYISHPRYPLLMPVSQVIVQEVFDTTNDDRAFRWLYALFYPVSLVLVFDGARRRAGSLAAALTVLVAAVLPFTLFEGSGGALGTYSDFPLACFWGAGVLLLTEAAVETKTGIAAGIFLGAGLLTKNEGGPLALAALGAAVLAYGLSWLVRRVKKRRLPAYLPALLLAGLAVVAAAGLSISWRNGVVNRNDEGYEQMRGVVKMLKATVDRLPVLPGPMWNEMRDREDWGDFWVILPPVLLLGVRGLWRKRAFELLLALLLGLGVFLVAYGNTPWGGAELVHPTWSRFLLQLSLPGLVLGSLALRGCVRELRSGWAALRLAP